PTLSRKAPPLAHFAPSLALSRPAHASLRPCAGTSRALGAASSATRGAFRAVDGAFCADARPRRPRGAADPQSRAAGRSGAPSGPRLERDVAMRGDDLVHKVEEGPAGAGVQRIELALDAGAVEH